MMEMSGRDNSEINKLLRLIHAEGHSTVITTHQSRSSPSIVFGKRRPNNYVGPNFQKRLIEAQTMKEIRKLRSNMVKTVKGLYIGMREVDMNIHMPDTEGDDPYWEEEHEEEKLSKFFDNDHDVGIKNKLIRGPRALSKGSVHTLQNPSTSTKPSFQKRMVVTETVHDVTRLKKRIGQKIQKLCTKLRNLDETKAIISDVTTTTRPLKQSISCMTLQNFEIKGNKEQREHSNSIVSYCSLAQDTSLHSFKRDTDASSIKSNRSVERKQSYSSADNVSQKSYRSNRDRPIQETFNRRNSSHSNIKEGKTAKRKELKRQKSSHSIIAEPESYDYPEFNNQGSYHSIKEPKVVKGTKIKNRISSNSNIYERKTGKRKEIKREVSAHSFIEERKPYADEEFNNQGSYHSIREQKHGKGTKIKHHKSSHSMINETITDNGNDIKQEVSHHSIISDRKMGKGKELKQDISSHNSIKEGKTAKEKELKREMSPQSIKLKKPEFKRQKSTHSLCEAQFNSRNSRPSIDDHESVAERECETTKSSHSFRNTDLQYQKSTHSFREKEPVKNNNEEVARSETDEGTKLDPQESHHSKKSVKDTEDYNLESSHSTDKDIDKGERTENQKQKYNFFRRKKPVIDGSDTQNSSQSIVKVREGDSSDTQKFKLNIFKRKKHTIEESDVQNSSHSIVNKPQADTAPDSEVYDTDKSKQSFFKRKRSACERKLKSIMGGGFDTQTQTSTYNFKKETSGGLDVDIQTSFRLMTQPEPGWEIDTQTSYNFMIDSKPGKAIHTQTSRNVARKVKDSGVVVNTMAAKKPVKKSSGFTQTASLNTLIASAMKKMEKIRQEVMEKVKSVIRSDKSLMTTVTVAHLNTTTASIMAVPKPPRTTQKFTQIQNVKKKMTMKIELV